MFRNWVARGIKVYQYLISPLKIPCCRFHPTCSEYARQSVLTFGVFRGLIKTIRRLLKFHPFHPGGNDPPDPKSRSSRR